MNFKKYKILVFTFHFLFYVSSLASLNKINVLLFYRYPVRQLKISGNAHVTARLKSNLYKSLFIENFTLNMIAVKNKIKILNTQDLCSSLKIYPESSIKVIDNRNRIKITKIPINIVAKKSQLYIYLQEQKKNICALAAISEAGIKAPLAAKQAIACVLRTFIEKHEKNRHKTLCKFLRKNFLLNSYGMICSSAHCMYIKSFSPFYYSLIKKLEKPGCQVLINKNGKLTDALLTLRCGKCKTCQEHPYKWKAKIKTDLFYKLLRKAGKNLNLPKVCEKFRVLAGRKLGFDIIKSNKFFIKSKNKNYVEIIGEGQGHLQGLCIIGAIALAKKGYSYQQILKYYFPQSKIALSDFYITYILRTAIY